MRDRERGGDKRRTKTNVVWFPSIVYYLYYPFHSSGFHLSLGIQGDVLVISSYPSFFFKYFLNLTRLRFALVKNHTDDAFSKRLVKQRRSPLFCYLRVQCPAPHCHVLNACLEVFFKNILKKI